MGITGGIPVSDCVLRVVVRSGVDWWVLLPEKDKLLIDIKIIYVYGSETDQNPEEVKNPLPSLSVVTDP
jgi:hypothetical protein